MKNAFTFLAACLLCTFTANFACADDAAGANFAEGDYFYNIDTEPNYKSAAFNDSDAEGAVKCWNWYYRPIRRVYTWRPRYYRPYYTYYRYYSRYYTTYFRWTRITIYKGADNNGAMLDATPAAGSPLAAQGLRKGDIITAIDGKPLTSLSDLEHVTASSRLSVIKGSNVKFAGNLVKHADEDFMKGFSDENMQEVEAGTLLTKDQIRAGDFNMYGLYDKNAGPVFGVKAADNSGEGVKVTEVMAGMPGQKAGFEVNDIITEINGQKITGEQAYSDAIDRAGAVARMKVICGKTGQVNEVDVTLNK